MYNLQGDVIALTNNSGSVVVAYSYDAWGKPLGVTGTLAATLGRLNPFRYRGYVWDEETGLYYLRSRYYRAEICRFVNEDSQHIVFIRKPPNYENYYAYCLNCPCAYEDCSGHGVLEFLDKIRVFLAAFGHSDKRYSVYRKRDEETEGHVIDPSGVEITWDRTKPRGSQWHMRHIPQAKYSVYHK